MSLTGWRPKPTGEAPRWQERHLVSRASSNRSGWRTRPWGVSGPPVRLWSVLRALCGNIQLSQLHSQQVPHFLAGGYCAAAVWLDTRVPGAPFRPAGQALVPGVGSCPPFPYTQTKEQKHDNYPTRQIRSPIISQGPRRQWPVFPRPQPQRPRNQRAAGATCGPPGNDFGIWHGERAIAVSAESQRHGSTPPAQFAAYGREQPTPHWRDRHGRRPAAWSTNALDHIQLNAAATGQEKQPGASAGNCQTPPFRAPAEKAELVRSGRQDVEPTCGRRLTTDREGRSRRTDQ